MDAKAAPLIALSPTTLTKRPVAGLVKVTSCAAVVAVSEPLATGVPHVVASALT